jgi:hypothetical protein
MLGAMKKALVLVVVVILLRQAGAQQPDYAALLRRCSQHEKEAMEHPHQFQFFEREQLEWGSETRAVIETKEGRVDRIVALNDRPLSPDQEKKQQQRIARLLNDPEALRDEVASQRRETRRRELMVATVPDAFLVEFSSVEPDGRLKFTFSPDPKFSPRSREAQLFKGTRGLLWIDPKQERIAAVQAELFKDVNFGWGIVGRLSKGGRFEVVQSQVSPGVWRITTLSVDFKGRAFFFKPLRFLSRENSTGFIPTKPDMSLRSALAQLLSQSASARATGGKG